MRAILASLGSGAAGALLVGEMGVGKTRLLSEVVSRLEADGWLIRHAVTSSSTSTIPFGALSGLLPRLPTPDLRLLLETVRQRLVDQARGHPFLLVVDDAHHLDDASAALIHRMVVMRDARVLATQRTGEGISETMTTLWKDGHLARTPVEPLSRSEHDVLVESMLGAGPDPALAAQLWQRTEGNPLFLRELVLAARDSGAVVRRGDVWVAARDIELPDRLVEIVEARMSRLDPRARHLLEIVAVGEPIDLHTVTQLGGSDGLASLERAGFVRALGDGDAPRLGTAHPLYGETLRERSPTATTTRIRRDLARELMRAGSPAAGDLIRAAEWTLQAGERPDTTLAVRAAGAALARSDPVRAERLARVALESDEEHAAATRLLGVALSAQGTGEPASGVLQRAFDLARSDSERVDSALAASRHLLWMMGDPPSADDALRAALDEVVESAGGRAELRAEQAIIRAVAGDLPGTIRLAQEVLDAPEASNRAVLTALIQSTLARCMLGRYDDLDEDLWRGQNLAADLADDEPLASAQLEITRLLYRHYMDIDGSIHDATHGHESAIRDGMPAGLWSATSAWMHIDRGSAADVVGLARRGLTELERFDPFNMTPMIRCVLSIGLGMEGKASAAAETLVAVGPPEILEPRTRTWFDRATTWVTAAEGRLDDAAKLAHRTGQHAVHAGLRMWGASLLSDAIGFGHAELVVEDLAALADSSAPPLVHGFARSARGSVARDPNQLIAAADALLRTGALVPAATAMDDAAELLRGSGAQDAERLALRAWVLRDRCQAHAEPRRLRPKLGLTSRQIEVVRHAASGRTSKDIAADLGVSPRTVDNHLAAAYSKLGINDRRHLARVVPEFGAATS